MHFTSGDSLKLAFYSAFFAFLLFGYNTVSSPYFETTFDSASIANKEVSVQEAVPEKKPKKNRPKVQVASPLAIAFNPEYVKIDGAILDHIKVVVGAPSLHSKVTPLNIVFDTVRSEPRGQVVGNKLILATMADDSERLKVFVHELGHIIDIFYLKKGLFSDPSDIFYAISWESFQTKKKGQKITDFVSWYALSNKYEDFSESFVSYVFHNDDFKARAKDSPILRQKYDFFRSHVFGKDEFIGTSFEKSSLKSYNWDITKVEIDTKKYLYYIR